jgi:hypothetical protein
MANIEKWGVSWLQVVLDGSGDWICSKAIRLKSLKFMPSAAGDKLGISEVTPGVSETLWPQITLSSVTGDPVGCLFNSSMPTQIKISIGLCTFSNISKAIVTFEFV